jgi:DNA-directed RNA polymerase specialized sigma24 family protein
MNANEWPDECLFTEYVDQRNQAAFAELHSRHCQAMIDWVMAKYGFKRGDAEEIAQQSFLKIHLKHEQYDRSTRLVPWLFKICNHEAVNFGLKRKAAS